MEAGFCLAKTNGKWTDFPYWELLWDVCDKEKDFEDVNFKIGEDEDEERGQKDTF